MGVQEEYLMLVEKIVAYEEVGIPAAKKALNEVLNERYGGVPTELRYNAFTQLNPDEIERAKRYLSVYLDSTRFKGEFPELARLIFRK